MSRPHIFLLALMSMGYVVHAYASNEKTVLSEKNAERPKIGLALSGGGARGAAHIGVLKQLEEQNIPIDFIAGTSMGALVGGLYASGLSPDEIEQIILDMDWEDILTDAASREDRSFRRKRDDDLYVVKPKARLKDGKFGLPSGIVVGQKVDFLLRSLTLNTANIDDFSDLSIPFKAMATDIVTGDEVVLESGDLAMALRASMSIPAVFTPVEIDGKFLVDGGVANNFPIEVVRQMGADIIIAIDISSPLRNRENLSNVLNITDQLTGFLTKRNSEAQIEKLKDTDILIVPNLEGITMMDFDRANNAVQIGYESAVDSFASLKEQKIHVNHYARQKIERIDIESLLINEIILDNRSKVSESLILTSLSSSKGELINLATIEDDIKKLYGWQLFENIRYDLIDAPIANTKNLLITVEEKKTGITYLQFGMKLFDDFSGENDFDLSMSYTNPYLNDLRGELRVGVQIGNEPLLGAELYQPLDQRASFFFGPAIEFSKKKVGFYEGNNITAEYTVESVSPALAFGYNLSNWGELKTGFRYLDGSANVSIGEQGQEGFDFENSALFLTFTYDKLNSIHFPTDGNFLRAEYRRINDGLSFNSKESVGQFEFVGVNAKSWHENTLITKVEFGNTVNDNAQIQNYYSLGGFGSLSGLKNNQLNGQHKGLLSGTYLRKIGTNSLFPMYLGASLEVGNVWQFKDDISFSDTITAGSLFVGVDSIIGPLFLAYGKTEEGAGTVYLYVGDLF